MNPEASSTSLRPKVLLITDIGADVDDTFALLALLGAAKCCDLTAIVTTGNHEQDRARVVRGWLTKLWISKSAVPIAAGAGPGEGGCFCPAEWQADETAEPAASESATELILKTAALLGPQLHIFGIGALTPLAEAIRADTEGLLQNVGGIHLQGNGEITPDGRLAPLSAAFNFREDFEAAKLVFEELQDSVPFHLLGKFAAYQVGITRTHLQSWNRPGLPDMCAMVEAQMQRFIEQNAELFFKLYPVPEELRDRWFEQLDKCCIPYDPLLVLSWLQPLLFAAEKHGEHVLIGNSAETHGVPDPVKVMDALSELIHIGVDRSQQPHGRTQKL